MTLRLHNKDVVAWLGSSLRKVYRIDGAPRFDGLLNALDGADRAGASSAGVL